MSPLVLASTSPYRRALLSRLGLPFQCRDPRVDEDGYKSLVVEPRALAERLAVAKATSVAADEPGCTIIGGDQLVAIDGRVLGKPLTAERAAAQLESLAGQTHALITAVAVWHDGEVDLHVDTTRLRMRPLAREEIERYIAADQPLDCAGSYKIESRGIALFESIESADQTAISGLPLLALATMLRRRGYAIP